MNLGKKIHQREERKLKMYFPMHEVKKNIGMHVETHFKVNP
jgi:hypothetical protein